LISLNPTACLVRFSGNFRTLPPFFGNKPATRFTVSRRAFPDERLWHGLLLASRDKPAFTSNFEPVLIRSCYSRGMRQRDAQGRQKQEELLAKSSGEGVTTSRTGTFSGKSNQAPNETEKKVTPAGRSA